MNSNELMIVKQRAEHAAELACRTWNRLYPDGCAVYIEKLGLRLDTITRNRAMVAQLDVAPWFTSWIWVKAFTGPILLSEVQAAKPKQLTFKMLKLAEVFEFEFMFSPENQCSGIQWGPWRKISARKYIQHQPNIFSSEIAYRIGSINAQVRLM